MVVDAVPSNMSSIAQPRLSEETEDAPPEPCPTLAFTEILAFSFTLCQILSK